MADRTYNPPPAPPEHAACPRCGKAVVPSGAGRAKKAGTNWRYACEGLRKAKGRRTCSYTINLPVPPNPAARPGLAIELREMGREHDAQKSVLRALAEMIEAEIPAGLAKSLPPGEIPEGLRSDLTELSNHACAAGLRDETVLLRALAKKGIGAATAAVVRGFRSA